MSPWIPCMSRTASFLHAGHLILCRSARAFRITIAETLPLFLRISRELHLCCRKYSGRIFGINCGRKAASELDVEVVRDILGKKLLDQLCFLSILLALFLLLSFLPALRDSVSL